MLSVTIGGTPFTIDEPQFKLSPKLEERWKCTLYVWDYTGTVFFSYGQKVTVTDPNPSIGRLFTGYVAAVEQDKTYTYPDATTLHRIDCLDPRHLPEKRTSNRLYTTPTMAGKVAADFVSDVLSAEGVQANYAVQFVTTQNDWNGGTLSSVVSTPLGDGDLELVSSGTPASASYMSQSDWATGSGSSVQLNPDGTVQLIGVSRTWDSGDISGQTLYGLGSPTAVASGGQYALSCTKQSETRSRMDFAGLWDDCIAEIDVAIGADIPKTGLTWRTTGWGNADGGFGYALEFTSTQIEFRKGTNSSGGGITSSLGVYTFSPKLAYGTYRLRVDISGSGFIASVNGVARLGGSDASYGAAGYLALRNRNGDTVTVTDRFDNFGVVAALSGTWTSPSVSVNSVSSVTRSIITWDAALSSGGTVQVQTTVNGGSSWQNCTNGGSIPGLGPGASGTGKSVQVKVTLSTTNTSLLPIVRNLQWSVVGGYVAAGTRSTAPLAIDYMDRANQSGTGTASDGQTYTKVGTGTDAIAGGELTITNTTGDVFERLGTKTAGDSEDSTRFALPNGAMKQGVVLRYVDANNWYALVASTTTLWLLKKTNGVQVTLASASVSLSLATSYRMRLRITGSMPANLSGRTWVDGTAEPITSPFQVTATDY